MVNGALEAEGAPTPTRLLREVVNVRLPLREAGKGRLPCLAGKRRKGKRGKERKRGGRD